MQTQIINNIYSHVDFSENHNRNKNASRVSEQTKQAHWSMIIYTSVPPIQHRSCGIDKMQKMKLVLKANLVWVKLKKMEIWVSQRL